jgi:MoxR-like ATPase
MQKRKRYSIRKPKTNVASRRFEPSDVERHGDPSGIGDQRSGALYVYGEKAKLAVRVALATGRPLLVRGAPGWGKSSLAPAVARHLNWRYLEKVISSRTQARDLMSEQDLVRRLSDAQGGGEVDPDWRRYVKPGVLWEAFDPAGAERQRSYFNRSEASEPAPQSDAASIVPAVVLLDEMDKADPDIPNNLLVALGSLQFEVEEIGPPPIKASPETAPLIIVTTNDERDLPRAFLRRCVEIELPALDGADQDGRQRKELLVKIGGEHLKGTLELAVVKRIADIVFKQSATGSDETEVIVPSPAEFIDTLRAVHEIYGERATDADIAAVIGIAVRKRGFGRSD